MLAGGSSKLREPVRVMFVYWGRRGALPQFTLALAHAAQADPQIEATISVSRQNEAFARHKALGSSLFAVDTFATDSGALYQAGRIPLLRRRLSQRLRQDRTQVVIELMPHVWSSFVMPVLRKAGVRYCTIVHDADAHPGDRAPLVNGLTDRAAASADLVLTLSSTVADRLSAKEKVARNKLVALFHPDLAYGPPRAKPPPKPEDPPRLLFLGRIMPYKGLALFCDTIDELRADGTAVEVGVFGEGSLGANAKRLRGMGAKVVNRWLTAQEFGNALARYHAVVLSHTEASQSGVAAAAFGSRVPVVASPVGGLVEQVKTGVNGVLARRADAPALAAAIKRLVLNPQFYRETCANLERTAEHRSMKRFVRHAVSHAVNPIRVDELH